MVIKSQTFSRFYYCFEMLYRKCAPLLSAPRLTAHLPTAFVPPLPLPRRGKRATETGAGFQPVPHKAQDPCPQLPTTLPGQNWHTLQTAGLWGSKSCSVQGSSWLSEQNSQALGTSQISPSQTEPSKVMRTAVMPFRGYFPAHRCL